MAPWPAVAAWHSHMAWGGMLKSTFGPYLCPRCSLSDYWPATEILLETEDRSPREGARNVVTQTADQEFESDTKP